MEVAKFGGDDEDTMKKKAQAQQDNENASVEDDWNKNDRCTTEDNISSKTMNLAAFGYQAWQLLYDHIEPISIYAQHLLFHFESSSSLSYIAAGSYSLLTPSLNLPRCLTASLAPGPISTSINGLEGGEGWTSLEAIRI